jgi:hypothetical protein
MIVDVDVSFGSADDVTSVLAEESHLLHYKSTTQLHSISLPFARATFSEALMNSFHDEDDLMRAGSPGNFADFSTLGEWNGLLTLCLPFIHDTLVDVPESKSLEASRSMRSVRIQLRAFVETL